MALFVEYVWVRKFLFHSKGENVVCRWGSSDDVVVWVGVFPGLETSH